MIRSPIPTRRRRGNLLLYLLLNILVSAATTLAVLAIWDANQPSLPGIPPQAVLPVPATTTPAQSEPAPTLPPIDQPLMEIVSVIAAGDLDQETVVLRHIGSGDLLMAGWKLQGERGSTYTFPEQPILRLLPGAEVQVLSRTGDDSATSFFWNRSEPAWQSGETVRLLDSAGNERAVYKIP